MIEIPSIAERQHRPCNTCVWTGNMYSCTMCALNYEMEGSEHQVIYTATH